MDARLTFKEGWIMLLRPFKFGELKEPLQKLTILYAFSEKPMINMSLSPEGLKEMELLNESYGKNGGLSFHTSYHKRFKESDDDYEERIGKEIDRIIKNYSTQEDYEGEIVQCYIENIMCRFYPGEYSIISRETFEHLLICPEEEYTIDIQNPNMFKLKEIRDRLHYIRSRGISENLAKK